MGENVQRLKQGEGLWSLYLEFDITLTAFWDFQLFFVNLFLSATVQESEYKAL